MEKHLYKKLKKNIFDLYLYGCIDDRGYYKENEFNIYFALDEENTDFTEIQKMQIEEFIDAAMLITDYGTIRIIKYDKLSSPKTSSMLDDKTKQLYPLKMETLKFTDMNVYSLLRKLDFCYKQIYETGIITI